MTYDHSYQADTQFEEALSIFQRGETERAEDLCNEILKTYPEHGNSLNLMGVICLKQGAYQKACHYIGQAIHHLPQKAPIFSHNLALAYTFLNNISAAVNVYKKAAIGFLERDEKEEVILCLEKAANLLRNEGEIKEAKKFYLSILELDPQNICAHNDLGVVYQLEGDLEQAVQSFNYAIHLDPTYATAYNNLALALLSQKKIKDAKEVLKQCLELEPLSFEAHLNLSIAFLEEENFEEALHYAKKALEIEPNDAGIHNNIGIILHKKGEMDEAIHYYKKALELDPSYENAATHLNLALQQKDQK